MKQPKQTMSVRTSLPPAYSYPRCCGQQTRLSCFGWHCSLCETYLPFRDEQGRTLAEMQRGAVLQQAAAAPTTEEARQ